MSVATFASAFELLFHEEADAAPLRGKSAAMPGRRGVRAVRRAEGVVDVDVGERRELPGERGVVRLLARVEAEVLEEEDAARRQRRDGLRRFGADAVGRERDAARRAARSSVRATGASEYFGSGAPFALPR